MEFEKGVIFGWGVIRNSLSCEKVKNKGERVSDKLVFLNFYEILIRIVW